MTSTDSKLHTAPSGKNILSVLVNLLADQEGVVITYELEEVHNAY